MTAGQFALNWVLNNRLVTSVIAGPRTEEQWREYLGALKHKFDAADEALIDSLVPREDTPLRRGIRIPNSPYWGVFRAARGPAIRDQRPGNSS